MPSERPRELEPRPRVVTEPFFWALLALGVAFFHRPLFGGEVFFYRDIFYLDAPMVDFFADHLRRGVFPLWNPLHNGGMPFLADANNQPLYPATYLALLFEPFRALSLALALHVIAGSAFTYALCRRLRLPPAAAFAGGAVFAYCGITLAQASIPGRLYALCLLPALTLAWQSYLESGDRRRFLLAAAVGALQALAGSPPISALSFLFLLGWGLSADTALSRFKRLVPRWALLAAAAVALAAVQLVPLTEMVAHSARGQGSYEDFSAWSLDPRRLPEGVLPQFLGTDTLDPEDYWGRHLVDSSIPYVVSVYVGWISILLAFFALRSKDAALGRRLRFFLATFAFAGLVFSLGKHLPGFRALYDHLPPLRFFRYPSKTSIVVALPLALLAAEGLRSALAEPARHWRSWAWGLWLAWAALGLALLATWWLAPTALDALNGWWFETSEARIGPGVLRSFAHAVAFLGLFCLGLEWTRRRNSPHLAVAVLAADLLVAGWAINPTAPQELLSAEPTVVERVREVLGEDQQTPGRLFRSRNTWPELERRPPSDAAVWRHLWAKDVLAGYQATQFQVPVVFHQNFQGLAPLRVVNLGVSVHSLTWERRLPLLSALGVSAILSEDRIDLPGVERAGILNNASVLPYVLYRNRRAAERVELVGFWQSVTEPERAVTAMLAPGFDPRRHAVVEGPVPSPPPLPCEPPSPEIVSSGLHEMVVRVRTPCDAILVNSEVYYPGWRLEVDGAKRPWLRVDYLLRGVHLEAGEHEVAWRYRPSSVYLGLAVSAMATVVGFFFWLSGRRRP